ncbi:MAG: response regulator transcription factor [Bacteroidia bacterium]|nr:response regulator transcription factor [Bacteroidia bacterium]
MAKKNNHPSGRELQILFLISDGLTDEQIAHQLKLSKNTVNIHRKKLLDKLEANNVAKLITTAFRKGIIK